MKQHDLPLGLPFDDDAPALPQLSTMSRRWGVGGTLLAVTLRCPGEASLPTYVDIAVRHGSYGVTVLPLFVETRKHHGVVHAVNRDVPTLIRAVLQHSADGPVLCCWGSAPHLNPKLRHALNWLREDVRELADDAQRANIRCLGRVGRKRRDPSAVVFREDPRPLLPFVP